MVTRGVLLICLLLLLTVAAPAQVLGNGRVSSTLSHDQIGLDETATLSITVKGVNDVMDVSTPTVRPSTGLQVMPVGRQFSMSTINGVTETSTQFNFLLTPLEKGRFVIEPVTVSVNGVDHETTSHRLEVTDALGRGRTTTPANPWSSTTRRSPSFTIPGDSVDPFRNRGSDILLESELDPKIVYKHEPAIYNLRLLTAVRLMRDPRYAPILPTGLVSVPFPQENSQEYRDGRGYAVTEAKTAFFPLTEGQYDFPASQIMISTGIFGRDQTLSTEPQSLIVMPLPAEGQPSSFTGAVGEYFEISADVDKKEVTAGETVELKIAAYGEGNLELVPYPYLPDWQGVEKKQSDGTSNVEAKEGRISSTRTYIFRLKIKEPGTYDLNDIALAYFRPAEERYEVVKAPPIQVVVKPGKPGLTEDGPAGIEEQKLPESERPQAEEGATGQVAGRISLQHLAGLAALALLGLALGLAKPGLKGPKLSWGRTGKPKDLAGLETAMASVAPGADRLAREEQLLAKGWSDADVEDYEKLKSRIGALRYGAGSSDDSSFSDLADSFQSLLRRVGK
jgi:hypothetical protein